MKDHKEPVVLLPSPKPLSLAKRQALIARARQIVRQIIGEEPQLDSPNFEPKELREFRDRGFQRKNR